jgi:hypothetical protein
MSLGARYTAVQLVCRSRQRLESADNTLMQPFKCLRAAEKDRIENPARLAKKDAMTVAATQILGCASRDARV